MACEECGKKYRLRGWLAKHIEGHKKKRRRRRVAPPVDAARTEPGLHRDFVAPLTIHDVLAQGEAAAVVKAEPLGDPDDPDDPGVATGV